MCAADPGQRMIEAVESARKAVARLADVEVDSQYLAFRALGKRSSRTLLIAARRARNSC
ncbi:hypothetical protein ALO46_101982 [Pseudomonas syringae pv. solidagae]|nr:hypothetical protein ALO46_101982 [Pseudomonas syringae pv. solidagae]RMR57148.1 hypothetical protein ALP85_101779 [Pseudomonas syringae pv. syringae]RMT31126.1 hypothetical protein ALP49_102004 [Pseudomonas syringae pv. solidagae]